MSGWKEHDEAVAAWNAAAARRRTSTPHRITASSDGRTYAWSCDSCHRTGSGPGGKADADAAIAAGHPGQRG